MNKHEPTTEYIQWGLPLDEIEELGQRLVQFVARFSPFLRNQPHDVSAYTFHYGSGLLRMNAKRNRAEIGRKIGVSPHNVHHFMSNSPWSGLAIIDALQGEIKQPPEFQAGTLLALDESAEQKAGEHSAGAGRQHNGRLGK